MLMLELILYFIHFVILIGTIVTYVILDDWFLVVRFCVDIGH